MARHTKELKEWISLPLRPWCVCLFIALGISLIAAISVLLVLSLRRNGFVTVGAALSAHSAIWRLSLLWTSLPSFVFTCLGLYWGAIAGAASDRQPFVGLNRPHGALARETVLLDYRTSIALTRWCWAFRNGHWQVASGQLAAVVFTVLSSLAAGLFVATAAVFQQEVPVLFNSTFDQSTLNAATLDVRVFLDAATATLIYGASDRPWTDHEHAFRPFYAAFEVAGKPPPTNATSLTAPTVAHSAYLNCAVLDPGDDYNITIAAQTSSPIAGAALVMTGTDRGCPIRQEFTAGTGQQVYFVTSAQTACGIAAEYSRLVFTYGHFSHGGGSPFLSNASVVSCAVGYRKTAGDLRVRIPRSPQDPSGAKREILGFAPSQPPQDSRNDALGFWSLFEPHLFESDVFSADTAWATTDFGTVVLYRALQRQGQGGGGGAQPSPDNSTVVGGEVLAASIADVFTSVYLTAMATVGLVPLQGGGGGGREERATATLETQLTRLFVVPWVAGTVVGVLGLILLVAGFVLRHAQTHKTLLHEEPAGLLAYAGLLEGSELIEVARRVRDADGFDGKVGETVLRNGKEASKKGTKGDVVGDYWKMTGRVRPRIVVAAQADENA
ncbi:Protein of unknown function DUF3433 [Fusarium oxysporum f. sp. vasinfectum]|nr:Protein of unknown function DUF3433 [Fusarium oxysporum f. sp. vasinfectum]